MASATRSLSRVPSQHTGEARPGTVFWLGSTRALGKVPFVFIVMRTHLYFRAAAVPVFGEVLSMVVTLAAGGTSAAGHDPVPGATYGKAPNDSWQNSSSMYALPAVVGATRSPPPAE